MPPCLFPPPELAFKTLSLLQPTLLPPPLLVLKIGGQGKSPPLVVDLLSYAFSRPPPHKNLLGVEGQKLLFL